MNKRKLAKQLLLEGEVPEPFRKKFLYIITEIFSIFVDSIHNAIEPWIMFPVESIMIFLFFTSIVLIVIGVPFFIVVPSYMILFFILTYFER